MSDNITDDAALRKRTLPHNLDGEIAVLGYLIRDNAALDRLSPLDPAMFHEPVNGRLFRTISAMIRKGRLADAKTLRDHFQKNEVLQEIGGVSYLLTLVRESPSLESVAIQYANLIRETYARRCLIQASYKAIDEAYALPDGEGIADVLDRAERAIGGVSRGDVAPDIGLRDAGVGVVERLHEPMTPGISTGLSELDSMIGGLHAPDLIILAGRPGAGKTSIAVNIGSNVARATKVDPDGHVIRDRVVAFISREMKAEQLAMRALSRFSSGADDAFFYTDFRSTNRPKPNAAERILPRLPNTLRILDRGVQTISAIRAACREIKQRERALDLIIVDYLQLLSDSTSRKDGRTQEVTAITMALKEMAMDFNCPVLALSQLSRAVEMRPDKRPQLSDLRESGSIEQDADIVLFAFREHYYLQNAKPMPNDEDEEDSFAARMIQWNKRMDETRNVMEIIGGKNRHGEVTSKELWCDLRADAIADKSPNTPDPLVKRPYWMDKD